MRSGMLDGPQAKQAMARKQWSLSEGDDMNLQQAPPPFDLWPWLRAWQETWWAGALPGMAAMLRGQRLAALIGAARQHSPLYRERIRGAAQLSDIAPVDKRELMQRFDDWSTDRRVTRAAAKKFLAGTDTLAAPFLGEYLLWTSSGTSGVPGWFVQDAHALAAYDALDALRLRGGGPLQPALGAWGVGHRFAFVGASGGHFAGVVSLTRLARIVPPPLQPALVLLSVLRPLQEIADALARFAPTVLITYPSVAAALAQRQRSGTLQLALQEVWLGGEQLSPAQRQAVRRGFGCTVRNCYGASECFSIAFECGAGALHLNEDWVIVEPVDQHLLPVPAGTLSHATLLTNLANRVQPILRYVLDDRVRLVPGACTCGSGFTRIEVQGRSGDTLHLPAARGHSVAIVPLALETAIEEQAQVSQFQVLHQAGPRGHTLELRFEPAVDNPRSAFARCRAAVEHYLGEQGVHAVRCTFSAAPPLRDARSGKLRRIRQAA
jgi:phenylacetate-coenzyme A ligase PaaK-like adenylate-forming protein